MDTAVAVCTRSAGCKCRDCGISFAALPAVEIMEAGETKDCGKRGTAKPAYRVVALGYLNDACHLGSVYTW